MPPRIFLLVVRTLAALAMSLGVLANLIFIIPSGIAAALLIDGLDARHAKWRGWRRPIDRTRALLFAGWFCLSLLGLGVLTLTIENHVNNASEIT